MERVDNNIINAVECLLFVSGEPILIEELCRVFSVNESEMRAALEDTAKMYESDGRGVLIYVTDTSVQLVSNKVYAEYVAELLQPTQTKSFSQSMTETLTIVAYRQPVTRAEIDSIRGVRSEYSVTQLIKQGFIAECGRKDVVGRPQLLGTTDKFLRKFGLHSVEELPMYEKLSNPDSIEQCTFDFDVSAADAEILSV